MVHSWELDFYENLRTEVVRQAVKDLNDAMRRSARLGCVCEEQKKLEEWFLSSWGQLLSGDNGEYIIEKCRQTYTWGSHSNGKVQLPEDVQKKICAEYLKGARPFRLTKKYGITYYQLNHIVRRWER